MTQDLIPVRIAPKGMGLNDFVAQKEGFFEALGDLVVTGPTGTNVNDFRVILCQT